jgi:hypothetical protein
MTIEASELTKELVNRVLLMFKQYQVERDIKVFNNGDRNMKQCFPLLDFLLAKF